MAVQESNLIKKLQLAISKSGGRLFRANSGMGWVGRLRIRATKNQSYMLRPGDIVISQARPFHGMPEGTADLIGFEVKKVTPEMLGKDIAIFKAVEVKTKNIPITKKQQLYINMVNKAGGIGLILNARDINGPSDNPTE